MVKALIPEEVTGYRKKDPIRRTLSVPLVPSFLKKAGKNSEQKECAVPEALCISKKGETRSTESSLPNAM